MKHLSAMICAAIAFLGLVGAAHAAPEPSAFKVLTYNTQFRPDVIDLFVGQSTAGGNQDVYGMDDKTRATLIAERIIASGADVVALQEVFLPEPYEVFVDQLKEKYPFFTERDAALDADVFGSGMVLFSKFPMRSLGGDLGPYRCMRGEAFGDCTVAFEQYDKQAQVEEKLTRKGIGYAMLDNERTGRPLHVFFTHPESSDEPDTRREQIYQALEFMATWLVGRDADDVVMLGDMNIKGPSASEYDPSVELLPDENFFEYQERIDENLGGMGLIDAWLQQSPVDSGLTVSAFDNTAMGSEFSLRSRIDYVLFRSPAANKKLPALCASHQIVERDRFRVDEVIDGDDVMRDLSDHFAVSLRIGRDSPLCDPRRAQTLGGGTQVTTGNIAQAGNVAWYHLTEPGTYSVNASAFLSPQTAMRVLAYRETDLSLPIEPIEGSALIGARSGPVVYLVSEPVYLRVDADSAMFSGSFQLATHQHQGANFDDAIFLPAGIEFVGEQMSAAVTEELDRVFFRIHQRALDSGDAQNLAFEAHGDSATFQHPPLRITVFDAHRQALPGLSLVTGVGGDTLSVAAASSPIGGAEQDLFFTVDREGCGVACDDLSLRTEWSSDYRQLDFGELTVLRQTEGIGQFGKDEITVFMSVDGADEVQIFDGKLDKRAGTYLNHRLPVGVTHKVSIRIFEDDPIQNDAFGIETLAYEAELDGESQLTDFYVNGVAAQGHYTLRWSASQSID